jgi:hypothetical protein
MISALIPKDYFIPIPTTFLLISNKSKNYSDPNYNEESPASTYFLLYLLNLEIPSGSRLRFPEGRRLWAAFFWLLFLAAKKSNSPQAKVFK